MTDFKYYVIGAVLGVLMIACIVEYDHKYDVDRSARPDASGREAPVQAASTQQGSGMSEASTADAEPVVAPPTQPMPASQIAAEYEANEVAADARYKGKKVTLSGKVGSIAKDILDEPYITLDADEFGLRSVQAYFDNGDLPQLAQLRKGQTVTIEGTCDGLMLNVLVRKSRFVGSPQ